MKSWKTIIAEAKQILAAEILCVALPNPIFLRWLNRFYNGRTLRWKGRFHLLTAKIFRERNIQNLSAQWRIVVGDGCLVMPLRSSSLWLDWDCAVSVLGHDREIKETYLRLINARAVDSFVDVGANYGMHSLIFLCNGIRAMTVEPNPDCVRYFKDIAERNHVKTDIRNVALGCGFGEVVLSYPERELWLGTVSYVPGPPPKNDPGWNHVRCAMTTLDEVTNGINGQKILVKIDTEGHELAVLKGAARLLREKRPLVIFESFRGEMRPQLFDLIVNSGMGIRRLPWAVAADGPGGCMGRDDFLSCDATNFIAVPEEGWC